MNKKVVSILSMIPATLNSYAKGNNYVLKWAPASGWLTTMPSNVMYTIDKGPADYNVIGDLNHGVTTTPINSVYSKGASHYICIYGYNDSTDYYYISDSNSAAPVTYTTKYNNAAKSTQARGIVW